MNVVKNLLVHQENGISGGGGRGVGEGEDAGGVQPSSCDDLRVSNIAGILQHLVTSSVSYVIPSWCTPECYFKPV